jgi:hypothetical protein
MKKTLTGTSLTEGNVNYEVVKNKSKIYFNGSIWELKKYGKIEIIGKSNKKQHYFCKFENDTIVEVFGGNIKRNYIKNPNTPNKYGVGFIGQGEHKSSIKNKITKEYNLWSMMIRRCYDINYKKQTVGCENCTVDERWHNFQNFCEDIPFLDNYNFWLIDNNNYQLDKDVKVKGNKIYSKDYCKFVTRKENTGRYNRRQTLSGFTYLATRISDNYKEIFYNQTEFAEKHNLSLSSINACLHKKTKKYKDWVFEILDNDI